MGCFYAPTQRPGDQQDWGGLWKVPPSSPGWGMLRGPRGQPGASAVGDRHLIPFPPLASWAAYPSFLIPGPRIPGLPSGGDHEAPPPFCLGHFQKRVAQGGGQSSSVATTEFAQSWKDRLTCPSLANPLLLPWLNSCTMGGGRNSPPPPMQPLLSLPECWQDPGHPREPSFDNGVPDHGAMPHSASLLLVLASKVPASRGSEPGS